MIQATHAERETLNGQVARKLSNAKGEPEWLLQQRLAAFRAFEELKLPQLSYGLHVSAAISIDLNDLRPLENATSQEGSAANSVTIDDLSVAASRHEAMLKPLMAANSFRNKLEALHAAFWNRGILVHAPKGKEANITLHLPPKQTEILRLLVIAEENAKITITESLPETSEKACRLEGISISAASGAEVKLVTIQKLGESVNSIISRKGQAENSATIDWVDISIGGGNTKQETVTILNGEGATSTLTGAFFGGRSQQLDILAKQVHNARNTSSNIQVKGALQGRAKAIVQSFTKIMTNAANSQGHQKANILLLSENARASPIPKLEIDNYDVKASHEASVGQLDREKLFYMMTRGMKEEEAVKLVVEGFFEPLIKHLPSEELKEELKQAISTRIEGK